MSMEYVKIFSWENVKEYGEIVKIRTYSFCSRKKCNLNIMVNKILKKGNV